MAVAYDAISNSGVVATTTLSWTHTPTGTPRGAVLLVSGASNFDDVTTPVTYGGVDMVEQPLSPFILNSTESWACYVYFLGSGIPTGAQTVVVTDSGAGGSSKSAVLITVTAAGETSVEDTDAVSAASSTSQTATLSTSVETAVFAAGFSGRPGPTNLTWDGSITTLRELDVGSFQFEWARKTSNPAAGSPTVQVLNDLADELGVFAIAVREAPEIAPQHVIVPSLIQTEAINRACRW